MMIMPFNDKLTELLLVDIKLFLDLSSSGNGMLALCFESGWGTGGLLLCGG
jgi:hypothetical protein